VCGDVEYLGSGYHGYVRYFDMRQELWSWSPASDEPHVGGRCLLRPFEVRALA
jgi:hypothetical protein